MTKDNHRTRIRDDIRARLLAGQIGPDDRLIDHVLAADLGVSRMPVREALMQLVSEGYLTSTSRGFALPDLTPAQIAEIFTLRKLLEPHAAALAAQSLAPGQLAALTQALEALHAAPDTMAFHRASEAFRNTWLDALPNQALRETIQRYGAQIQAVRLATMKDPLARQTIARGLSALLAAFTSRDGFLAQDLMTRFIHQAQESLTLQTRDPR